MAEVYRALDKNAFDHWVALKILSHDARHGSNAQALRGLFLQEASALSKVRSPYVVAIIAQGVEKADGDEIPYIAMEYLEGRDLAEELRLRSPAVLPVCEAVDIGVAVCEAVQACHRHSVIHRDIKPANIFLAQTPTGFKPVLLDLSVAKLLQADDPNRSTTQMVVGTRNYMAPEQEAARPATSQSDQYAVAAVLFRCLTGTNPKARDVASFLRQHPQIPPELQNILVKALSIDPKDRFPSVFDLGAAIHPFASPLTRHLWFPHYNRSKVPSGPQIATHTSPTVVVPSPASAPASAASESLSGAPSTLPGTIVDPNPPGMMAGGGSLEAMSVVTSRTTSPRLPQRESSEARSLRWQVIGSFALGMVGVAVFFLVSWHRQAPPASVRPLSPPVVVDIEHKEPTAEQAGTVRQPQPVTEAPHETVLIAIPVDSQRSAVPPSTKMASPPLPPAPSATISATTKAPNPRRRHHPKSTAMPASESPVREIRKLERAPDGSPIIPLDFFDGK